MRSLVLCLALAACSAPATAGHAVVDCAKADQGQLVAEGLKLLGAPSWAAFEAMVISDAETIGGCAMLAVIDKYRPGGQSIAASEPVDRRAVVERVRASFGGVTWMTAAGAR